MMALRIAMSLVLFTAACEGPAGPAGDPADRVVHRATFDDLDNSDDGLVRSRVLEFTKLAEDTSIRVSYFDAFGAKSAGDACTCEWEVIFDGDGCADPGPISGEVVSIVEQTLVTQTVTGWCDELSAGDITVEVAIGNGGGPVCDCVTGYGNVTGVLEAEELR